MFSFSSLLIRFGLLIGTGFSEAVLEERSTSLGSRVIATPKVGIISFFSLALQYHA